ncbi:MFS transporter [Agreia sp. VKM Ac-1783]|uniref:MFS transporter n=1 Tax=Agreia sp. VKM Ac-1783 TaxID=1938889 RepID=UPI000A3D2114|nr:MFS transporter [Agreia sp. VKM Ac-1783]
MPETRSVGAVPQALYPMIAIPIAMLGLMVALLAPMLVTIALRLNELEPQNVAGNFSLVLGISALFAFVANPIGGRLSDRSMSRFGMRKIWIVIGSGIGYAGIIATGLAPNVVGVVAGFSLAQVGFNFALAALIAMLPDQVRSSRRGRVASFVSLSQNFGSVVATFLVQLIPAGLTQSLLPSAIGLALMFAFVLPMKDKVRAERSPEAFGVKVLFMSFVFNPRKYPDLGWAWLTRFLMIAAGTAGGSYLPLFLIDHLGVSEAETPNLVFQATLANGVGVIVMTVLLGWLSDKLGRRKPFVILSAIAVVIGLVLMAFANDFSQLLVSQVVLGAGLGAFLAVELALISDILPSAEDTAKDLGVVNIAQALPQSLVPAGAPVLINAFGYPGLFLGGALLGALGALTITRVKSAR